MEPVKELELVSVNWLNDPVLIRPPEPSIVPIETVELPATVSMNPPVLRLPVTDRLPVFAAKVPLAASTSGDWIVWMTEELLITPSAPTEKPLPVTV